VYFLVILPIVVLVVLGLHVHDWPPGLHSQQGNPVGIVGVGFGVLTEESWGISVLGCEQGLEAWTVVIRR